MTSTFLRARPDTGLDILNRRNADDTEVTWMEQNWMFFSWAFFLFGAGCLITLRFHNKFYSSPRNRQIWLGWLSVVMYCLHQSEEHAYDLRGWRYSFVPYFNLGPIHDIFSDICAEDNPSCPLDPKITLYVNIYAIWVGFGGCMVAATLSDRFLLAAAINWGVAVVNGLGGHILPALLTQSYNPGVIQSIVMVPLGIYIVRESGNALTCIGTGVLFHALLISCVNVIFRLHTPETVTTIIFMVVPGLILPLFIANAVYKQNQKKST
eukprot:scaffold48140_cov68-Cyclotella_meneghiniana.AAC.7